MAEQHTPGPWKVHGQNIISYHELNIGIAKVLSNIGQPAKANAALIAAAPELLEACKFFMTALETGLLVRGIGKDNQSDWALKMANFVKQLQKAQAAIAKAERSEQ